MPERAIPAGTTILSERERAGVLYVLIEGEVAVLKGDYQLHTIANPGAVFGELSVLLDAPHHRHREDHPAVAVLRDREPARVSRVPGARFALAIASLLAQRLNLMTTYLAT